VCRGATGLHVEDALGMRRDTPSSPLTYEGTEDGQSSTQQKVRIDLKRDKRSTARGGGSEAASVLG
jgi:hypothetical protein